LARDGTKWRILSKPVVSLAVGREEEEEEEFDVA